MRLLLHSTLLALALAKPLLMPIGSGDERLGWEMLPSQCQLTVGLPLQGAFLSGNAKLLELLGLVPGGLIPDVPFRPRKLADLVCATVEYVAPAVPGLCSGEALGDASIAVLFNHVKDKGCNSDESKDTLGELFSCVSGTVEAMVLNGTCSAEMQGIFQLDMGPAANDSLAFVDAFCEGVLPLKSCVVGLLAEKCRPEAAELAKQLWEDYTTSYAEEIEKMREVLPGSVPESLPASCEELLSTPN